MSINFDHGINLLLFLKSGRESETFRWFEVWRSEPWGVNGLFPFSQCMVSLDISKVSYNNLTSIERIMS